MSTKRESKVHRRGNEGCVPSSGVREWKSVGASIDDWGREREEEKGETDSAIISRRGQARLCERCSWRGCRGNWCMSLHWVAEALWTSFPPPSTQPALSQSNLIKQKNKKVAEIERISFWSRIQNTHTYTLDLYTIGCRHLPLLVFFPLVINRIKKHSIQQELAISVRITVIRRVIIFLIPSPKQRCSSLLSLFYFKFCWKGFFLICIMPFFTGPLQRKWTRSTSPANQHRASDSLKDPNFPCHPFVISCKKTDREKTCLPQLWDTRNTLQRRLCKCVQARHQIQQQGKNMYTPHFIVHKLLLQKGRTDALRGKGL